MSKVIALTGATGFIGTALCGRLKSEGIRIRALCRDDRAARRAPEQAVRWISGSLEDTASLERLLKGSDTVIHCAGLVRGSEWQQFKKVNTDGVARLVRIVKQMHPSPRFLLLSSLAAREPKLSPHAASKRGGEEVLRSAGADLEWMILRPPAVYGPGDREIAPLLRMMCSGVTLQASPPTSRFAMIYIDDLTAAIAALIAKKDWNGSTFELHDGKSGGYDWREVAQTVARLTARPVRCFQLPPGLIRSAAALNLAAARLTGYAPMLTPGKVRELAHPDWTCDNAAIFKASGWRPRLTLGEGMKKTLIYLGLI